MAYYYVPIEQIKKGSNIKSIENYIGPYPYYNDCTYNRVKDGFYDLCLIVEIDREDSLTAQEVMTGRQIPIVDMHLDSSGYIDFARNSIDGVHTYIRNVIRKVKICNGYFEMEESTAFNETTNLEMLDFPKAKHIIELYQQKYNKENLKQLLDNLFKQGEEIYKEAELLQLEEQKKQKAEQEQLKRLLKQLKTPS